MVAASHTENSGKMKSVAFMHPCCCCIPGCIFIVKYWVR